MDVLAGLTPGEHCFEIFCALAEQTVMAADGDVARGLIALGQAYYRVARLNDELADIFEWHEELVATAVLLSLNRDIPIDTDNGDLARRLGLLARVGRAFNVSIERLDFCVRPILMAKRPSCSEADTARPSL